MRLNKHIHIVLLGLWIWLFRFNAHAQENYYRYPLDSLPHYVSPFGSLRDNHFHSGADLSTKQQEGKVVYAAAKGFVSRIKVQSGGYGKAIYIDHPNGQTTVYGHLQSYYGEIGKWVNNYQYKHKTFEFDYIFPKPVLLVNQSDTIGISGNSGTSTGPHLHFEIRNSKTEEILNVAQFGILQLDTIKPYVESIYLYKFVPDGLILKKQVAVTNNKLVQLNDTVKLFIDTIALDADMYGVGLVAWDKLNNNKDPRFVYKYNLHINNVHKFTFAINKFSFDKTKFINAHIDYPYYRINGTRIQKAFLDDGNAINLYTYDKEKGKFYVEPVKVYQLLVSVFDNNGNAAYYAFMVKGLPAIDDIEKIDYLKKTGRQTAWYPHLSHQKQWGNFKVHLDANTLYDTLFVAFDSVVSNKSNTIYRLNNYFQPVHKSFEVAIKINTSDKVLNCKKVILYAPKEKDSYRSIGGKLEGEWLTANASNFGYFTWGFDTTPPIVNQVFVNKINNTADTLSWNFRVTDNLSGIASYQGYLNNQWVLLDYDAKNNMLTYTFDHVYAQQKQEQANNLPAMAEMVLTVTDRKGNTTKRSFNMVLK